MGCFGGYSETGDMLFLKKIFFVFVILLLKFKFLQMSKSVV
jgi:hypothetical protein